MGGQGDPIDWSFQSHIGVNLHKAEHPDSNFRRAILEQARMTEANFEGSDFRKASMRQADLMKSAFDDSDFRGADLRKARMNMSNFRRCRFEGADLRGIRGRYAIWEGSDWWKATMDDDLRAALSKKWGIEEDE